VIGVIPKEHETGTVEEFFQLFKTPWELYRAGESYDVVLASGAAPEGVTAKLVLVYGSNVHCIDRETGAVQVARLQNAKLDWRGNQIPLYGQLLTFKPTGRPTICTTTASEVAAIEVEPKNPRIIRLGYDLFEEIAFLLTAGQPVENALVATLDLHIALLRNLILGSGVPLIEIPPAPAGYDFAACLTHDIDFVGIRRHKFDHTMWGFLYRSTLGAAWNSVRGKVSLRRLMECWKAAVKLPFVYLGWARDFWMPFEWYLEVEKNLSPTYFFIPFKRRRGDKVTVSHAERRGCAYDITDIPDWIARLQAEGCEIGVHGIDAWHSIEMGREELNRVASVAGKGELGMRSHWLLSDGNTYRVLEQAGYSYDSTCGYNETPGYRSGTTQVFRPPGARKLLELPMHIQDGALFLPGRLGLSETEAERRCEAFVESAQKGGGVLTVLWHDRSHGPERFWGDFYVELIKMLKARKAWFGTAAQVVAWFRKRREVTFQSIRGADAMRRIYLCGTPGQVIPPFRVRIHATGSHDGAETRTVDVAWDGDSDFDPQPVVSSSVRDTTRSVAANAA
jgi:peptidoglycan/xylan/chitin deacetylase (PgdA/CDA1 family)